MTTLIYSMGVSLDGFVADRDGKIDWSAPDEELHRFHNERVREQSAQLMGRRLYEAMLVWETLGDDPAAGPVEVEFASIWKPLPKVVFSRTLERVEGNARLATADPADELARLDGDVGIGGADLAATFVALDLVDEYQLFVAPVVLGAGTPFFPPLERRLQLELVDTRTFSTGVEYLRYLRRR
jgi:dihydrofolate reductase